VFFSDRFISVSEYSDENMMDTYNLAICFGPTLMPVPEDRDLVQVQGHVNNLVKNIITQPDELFPAPTDGDTVYERWIIASYTVLVFHFIIVARLDNCFITIVIRSF